VEVTPVSFNELSTKQSAESSASIRSRVIKARDIQTKRFSNFVGVYCNAQMRTKELQEYCDLDEASRGLLKNAMDRLGLSARAYDRILKVGRTIADLDDSDKISAHHIAEAIQFRSLDRENWAA